jgi:hypothetical protein
MIAMTRAQRAAINDRLDALEREVRELTEEVAELKGDDGLRPEDITLGIGSRFCGIPMKHVGGDHTVPLTPEEREEFADVVDALYKRDAL